MKDELFRVLMDDGEIEISEAPSESRGSTEKGVPSGEKVVLFAGSEENGTVILRIIDVAILVVIALIALLLLGKI
ncbi:hypothetical protein [Geoglobus acetivorans]|uniref:Uncharacterized protein n=1 Tax=Geoglobus acetivorans TaxID=565033 RepID=A0A0A7GFC7_GEOAI|nr:hypothetical protein GACE_1698 [Geoglobus acetivorans]